MKRSLFIQTIILAILLIIPFAGSSSEKKKKPNVLFVLIDDIGPAWLPPYARQISEDDLEPEIVEFYQQIRGKTEYSTEKQLEAARNSMPFVDKLSEDGMIFNMCFASAPLCAPSRSGILSANYQQRYGAYDNADVEHNGVPEQFPFLSKQFQEYGYNTGMIGKWHVGQHDETLNIPGAKAGEDSKVNEYGYQSSCASGHNPLDNGFDYYFGYNNSGSRYYEADDLWEGRERVPKRPEGEFLTDLFSQKAADFIEESLKKEEPFFVYYAPKTIHGRLDQAPEKYQSKFNTGVKSTNNYAGHLLALDEGIKHLYSVLKRYGEENNTLFVIAADNGAPNAMPPYNAPFKGGKGTGWLGGSHVPLIIVFPDQTRHAIINDLVSTIDVLPTALDFAGIVIPENIDGRSLKPLLSGKAKKGPHNIVFSSSLHSTRWSHSYFGEKNKKDSGQCPLYAWGITDEHVLLYITETPKGLYKTYPDGLPAKQQLSNWKEDPKQSSNLIEENTQECRRIRIEINNWLKQMAVPVLNHQDDYLELLEITD